MKNISFEQFGLSGISVDDAFARAAQSRVDTYNATRPREPDGTGVHCEKCLDRCDIAFVHPVSGNFTIRPCSCAGLRTTVRRLQRIGLWERAQRCTLASFRIDTQTQKSMKEAAERFIADSKGHWFVLCGQSGAGKTHIATAAFVSLCRDKALDGQYCQWVADSRRMKDPEQDPGGKLRESYKAAELLYVDDLLKTSQGTPPTDADVRMAFEILDCRYNARRPTIISTEWPFAKLNAIDNAVAGRIKEMAGPFLLDIMPDESKNYRLRL